MADPRPLRRDQLAAFLNDHESIKRFERLFQVAGDLTPTDIATLFRLVQEASIDAGTADDKAVSALSQLILLAKDSAINSGAAENKADEALSSLNRIANALELLSVAPLPQENTFLRGDYIDLPLDGPHVTQERRIQWNKDDGTIDIGLFNGVTLQAGQEMHYYAKNTSGVTIPDGASVMATGTIGASGRLAIAKAVADGSVPAKYMIGVATQEIADNAFGYVTSFGLVRNIDTTGAPYGEVWADGDVIYFSPTIAGGLTNVEPTAPDLKLPIAIVVYASAGAGSIFVRMTNGQYLHDLHDAIISSPTTGDLVRYNTVTSAWENVASTTVLASDIHAATSKVTPVDADEFPLADSAASFSLKNVTWANIKATLQTWLNTLATIKLSSAFQLGDATANLSGSFFNVSNGSKSVGISVDPSNVGASTTFRIMIDNVLIWLQEAAGNCVVPKTSGVGIKVDPAAPTFGWRDLLGFIETRTAAGGGAAALPDYVAYRGSLYQYRFGTIAPNNHLHEAFINYHIPHDYVPGTDLHFHVHWSQIVVDTGGAAGVPGVAKWYMDFSYADGHGTPGGAADPFVAPLTISVTQQGSTTQYGHMLAEVAFTNNGGDATHLDRNTIAVDGVVMLRIYRDPNDAADTLDQDAFVHFCDIHYQSTNMATKQKAPNFYV